MPNRVTRIEQLFSAALDLAEAERTEFLARQCGDDDALRREVEELIRFDRSPAEALPAATDEHDAIGTRIGPYTIRERIGEGGMGIVYRAEQSRPVRRHVAIKVLKPGLASREVLARFEAERQALVLMDSPNIAKLHDAGTTADGRPFFAMELVAGVPITEYCNVARLGIEDRLRLFVTVCRAVQHAHQKGVIHRDLKPSNVLVAVRDGRPTPVVIDFGIAKAISVPLTEKTLFTAHHQILGTLEYMSPEQAELAPMGVDTRADVYSLGVLLYELLAGAVPIDAKELRTLPLLEAQRRIREEDPARPSTRISTLGERADEVASARRTEPRSLAQRMRGDLDWITMRCLEKDLQRRYQSASDLADDVERHLDHEPVLAGPPSLLYRVRKFVRRNRAATAVVAAIAVTVVLGLAGMFAERQNTLREKARLEQVAFAAQMRALEESTALGLPAGSRLRTLEQPEWSDRRGGFAWQRMHACATPPEPRRVVLEDSFARQIDFHPAGDRILILREAPSELVLENIFEGSAGKVELWSLDTMTPVWELPGDATATALLPDGLVVASRPGGRLAVFDPTAPTDTPVAIGESLGDDVLSIATASTGAIAAVARRDNRHVVRVLDLDGDVIVERAGIDHASPARIGRPAFSPSGDRLVVGDASGTARVLDVGTGAQLATLAYSEIHRHPDQAVFRPVRHGINDIAFSPDGRRIAIAGDHEGRAAMWNAGEGHGLVRVLDQIPLTASPALTLAVAFDPDSRYLAVTGNGSAVALHSTRTGERLTTLRTRWDTGFGENVAVAIGPDARTLAVATRTTTASGGDGVLSFWDLAELPLPEELLGAQAELWDVLVEGDRFVYAVDKRAAYKWDLETGRLAFAHRDAWLHPTCLALRPAASGRRELAVGGWSGRGIVLNPDTGEVIGEFELPEDLQRPSPVRANVGVDSLAYSPEGGLLYLGPGSRLHTNDRSAPAPVIVLDADELREVRRYEGAAGGVCSIAVTRDRLIGLSDQRGRAFFWDLAGEPREPFLRLPVTSAINLFLDPDRQRLFVQATRDSTQILDPRTGEEIGRWMSGGERTVDLDFHPGGGAVLRTSENQTTLWDGAPANRLLTRLIAGRRDFRGRARFAGDRGFVASIDTELTWFPNRADPEHFEQRLLNRRAIRAILDRLDGNPNRYALLSRLGLRSASGNGRRPLIAEVDEALRASPELDPAVRTAALRTLAGMTDCPTSMAVVAWVLADPRRGTPKGEFPRLRGYAERALRSVRPGTFQEAVYAQTLALVDYGLGHDDAVLESLQIARKMFERRSTARCGWPPELFADLCATPFALAAATHARRGDRTAAMRELEQAWTIGLGGPVDESSLRYAYERLDLLPPDGGGDRSAARAVGPPDASYRGRSANAWFPGAPGRATLTLEFEREDSLAAVRVCEVGKPGALEGVVAIDAGGNEVRVWPGDHAELRGDTVHYSGPELRTRAVRIELDSTRTAGQTGIDTVRLIGARDRQWPAAAR